MWAPLATLGQLPPDGVLGRAVLELPSVHRQVLAGEQTLVLAASAGSCDGGRNHVFVQPHLAHPQALTTTHGPDVAAAQHAQQVNARHRGRGTTVPGSSTHWKGTAAGMARVSWWVVTMWRKP